MNKVLKYTLAAAVAMTMTVSSYALITVTWGAGGSTGFDDMTGKDSKTSYTVTV